MIVHMIKNNAEEILCEHFILWNLYMYNQNNKYDILLLIVLIKTIHTHKEKKKEIIFIYYSLCAQLNIVILVFDNW